MPLLSGRHDVCFARQFAHTWPTGGTRRRRHPGLGTVDVRARAAISRRLLDLIRAYGNSDADCYAPAGSTSTFRRWVQRRDGRVKIRVDPPHFSSQPLVERGCWCSVVECDRAQQSTQNVRGFPHFRVAEEPMFDRCRQRRDLAAEFAVLRGPENLQSALPIVEIGDFSKAAVFVDFIRRIEHESSSGQHWLPDALHRHAQAFRHF